MNGKWYHYLPQPWELSTVCPDEGKNTPRAKENTEREREGWRR